VPRGTTVGTSVNGANAFFARDDLVNGKFITPATAENLYNPYRIAQGRIYAPFIKPIEYIGK
jgi:hypothetical protein